MQTPMQTWAGLFTEPWSILRGHPQIQRRNLYTHQGGIVKMLEQPNCMRLDWAFVV